MGRADPKRLRVRVVAAAGSVFARASRFASGRTAPGLHRHSSEPLCAGKVFCIVKMPYRGRIQESDGFEGEPHTVRFSLPFRSWLLFGLPPVTTFTFSERFYLSNEIF